MKRERMEELLEDIKQRLYEKSKIMDTVRKIEKDYEDALPPGAVEALQKLAKIECDRLDSEIELLEATE